MISVGFTVGEFVGTTRRKGATTCVCVVVALLAASCDASMPVVQRSSPVDDVPMISILNEPRKFNAVRLRVRGVCRLGTEGPALYLSREPLLPDTKAIWLNLGGPIKPPFEIRNFDGREVIVEGTYDATKPPMGYTGSLKDIQAISAVGH